MTPVIGDCLQTGIHDAYIIASFALSAVVLLAMVGWIVWSKKALKKEIMSRMARDVRRNQAQKLERAL
ncbi:MULTISPECIES: heme exporter protein CcmD [Corallincola]|uniref:Heme exporter protein D n=3 Tax=Corallincola TaxID=1775176 RepID=A0A368N2Y8_9GAMM|nr:MULTISPECIES: heme exporter protein CcmD [Corallincola]RCU44540.1 heme exporter protein CcmD [Corallincola holothuriorum]TAA40285.1 heme exporter protein CcmD [Corallincola spongiicola]TCI05408.1 heme exporter protein CcmD [Corallincola luteus]